MICRKEFFVTELYSSYLNWFLLQILYVYSSIICKYDISIFIYMNIYFYIYIAYFIKVASEKSPIIYFVDIHDGLKKLVPAIRNSK